MTTVALSAFPVFYDDDGNPLSGGKVFTYAAGTLNPKSTWTDRAGTTLNSNPITLDSAGRADIWLTLNEPYDIVVQNSDLSEVIRDVLNFYGGADPAQLTVAGIVPATGGTYTGPVVFAGGANFNGTAAQDLATLDSLNIAAVQTSNLWINPDFYVNQRAATTAGDGAYGFDRAVTLCESGSVTLGSFDTAGLTLAGNALVLTQPDPTPKRMGICQIVEARDCLSYRGKNLAFSFQARCSAAATIRCALVAWTGTQDSPTRDVVNSWTSTNYTAGNFFVANTTTIATAATAMSANVWTDVLVSSASAGGVVVPLTMKNLYMVVWTEGTAAQNVVLNLTSMRCGQGTVAPLWTPPNAEVERAKCRRFLNVWQSTTTGDHVCAGQCVTTTVAFVSLPFDVEMRAAPTSATATGSFAVSGSNGAPLTVVAPGIGMNSASTRSILLSCTVASGLIAGNAAFLTGTLATSQILVSAEL